MGGFDEGTCPALIRKSLAANPARRLPVVQGCITSRCWQPFKSRHGRPVAVGDGRDQAAVVENPKIERQSAQALPQFHVEELFPKLPLQTLSRRDFSAGQGLDQHAVDDRRAIGAEPPVGFGQPFSGSPLAVRLADAPSKFPARRILRLIDAACREPRRKVTHR